MSETSIAAIAAENLYRVETYTDMEHGDMMCFVPMTVDGIRDPGRPKRFISTVAINIGQSSIPMRFEIKAEDLAEALARYPGCATEFAAARIAEFESQRTRTLLMGAPGRG